MEELLLDATAASSLHESLRKRCGPVPKIQTSESLHLLRFATSASKDPVAWLQVCLPTVPNLQVRSLSLGAPPQTTHPVNHPASEGRVVATMPTKAVEIEDDATLDETYSAVSRASGCPL